MKVTLSLMFILASCSAILGLPATTTQRKTEDEVEIIPLERQTPYGDQPIVDTGFGGFGGFGGIGGPFSNPFSGLLENLEGIMGRMRQQMETLLRRFPVVRGNGTSEEIPDFAIGGGIPPFQFGDIDLGKGNTTSVTKVIDGHKVVINETEYKKDDEFGGAFFKVRIIDVKPDSSELTTNKDVEEITTTTTSTIKDRESIENSSENEISKSREATRFDNIETFDEVDTAQPSGKFTSTNRDTEWNDVMPIEPFEGNAISFEDRLQPIDLSGDIRINQIMADADAPMNPDAELIYELTHPQNQNVKLEQFINPR